MSNSVILHTEVQKFDSNLGLHYICIPDEIALQFSTKFPFRVFCTIKSHTFPAAIIKHGLDGFIIQMGKQTIKAAICQLGENLQIQLVEDKTEHGFVMPEEFIELLSQDDLGSEAWSQLTTGAQRSFLHYLVSAKSQETRIKRSITILNRAREIVAEKRRKSKQKE